MVPFLHHCERLVLFSNVGDFHLPAPSGEDEDGSMIILCKPVLCSIVVSQPVQYEWVRRTWDPALPLPCLLAARLDGTVYPGVHVSNRDVLHAVGPCTQRTWQVQILPAYRYVVAVIIPCRGCGAIRPPESGVPAEALISSGPRRRPLPGSASLRGLGFHHRSTDLSIHPVGTPRLPVEAEWGRDSPAVAPQSMGYWSQTLA
ncbi:hypothetical protein AAWM_08374 [Aspergillus awamori]|uniref:Uncharacterized protein n=1 Tax=Aspergillus awamori TaxID=105351 RepID=A0A401L1U7_ASPAW|nr:hypothetical protein AAWM_08374 [Aspergillus awamori]